MDNVFRLARRRPNLKPKLLNLPNPKAPKRVPRFHRPQNLPPPQLALLLESIMSSLTQNPSTTLIWTWCAILTTTICSTTISATEGASPRALRTWTGRMVWVWIVTRWKGCWSRCRVLRVRWRRQRWGVGGTIITTRIIHIAIWTIMVGIRRRRRCIRILGRPWPRIHGFQDQGEPDRSLDAKYKRWRRNICPNVIWFIKNCYNGLKLSKCPPKSNLCCEYT